MVHGPIMEIQKKYLKYIYFGLQLIQIKSVLTIIINTADGKFYISSSTTARKQKSNAYKPYIAIAPTGKGNSSQYKPYIDGNEPFNTLEDTYKAYADVVKNDYPNYKDTLPQ